MGDKSSLGVNFGGLNGFWGMGWFLDGRVADGALRPPVLTRECFRGPGMGGSVATGLVSVLWREGSLLFYFSLALVSIHSITV